MQVVDAVMKEVAAVVVGFREAWQRGSRGELLHQDPMCRFISKQSSGGLAVKGEDDDDETQWTTQVRGPTRPNGNGQWHGGLEADCDLIIGDMLL